MSLLALLGAGLESSDAAGWHEVKIGSQPYVTYESFCAFYQFDPKPISSTEPTVLTCSYGTLTLTAGSRDARWEGRRIWLSFPFVYDERGKGFISKLDVIKLFDPLIRRKEMAPRKKVLGVIIDPGHGGADNGATSRGGFNEKTGALDTARRLKTLLETAGIATKMTRNQDEFISLEERADLANQKPDWIFISLHYNSGPSHAHGIETYSLTPRYSSSTGDSGRPTAKDRINEDGNANDSLNLILADYIHQNIAELHSPEGDRGLKRARFVVLKKARIPAVLVEGGFLTNGVDARLIVSGIYRQKLAQAVANAVQSYIRLMNSPLEMAPTMLTPGVAQPLAKPSPTIAPTAAPTLEPSATPNPTAEPVATPIPDPEEKKKISPVSLASPELLLRKAPVVPLPVETDATNSEKPASKPSEQATVEPK